MYEYPNGTYQPDANYTADPIQPTDPQVNSLVDSAFGKALASAILCEFPIASIIAIVQGNSALNLAEEAKNLAAMRHVKASGKVVAATVLGKIGKILGIVMTIFWAVYLILVLAIFSNI